MRSVVRLNMAGAFERGARRSTWHGALVRRLSSAVVLGRDRTYGAPDDIFALPKVLLLPRWDVWAPVLRLAVGASQRWRCHIIKVIVNWVETMLVKFDARIGRLIHRLECMIPACALEYVHKEDGTVVALAPLEQRKSPSFPTFVQQHTANLVAQKFDALTDDERLAFPLAIRRLLDIGGELRAQFDEFRGKCQPPSGSVNPITVELRPLRHWRRDGITLHEHIYAFCGALSKMTSVERECAFSVLKCYILRGNYHASLLRLSIELDLASGSSRVKELTPELLQRASDLQRRLENWSPEETGKARHLFYAAHQKALARLTFKELVAATTGPAAVPAILHEVFTVHGGDVAKLKVMKLATLIRFYNGTFKGRVSSARHDELLALWRTFAPLNADLELLAAETPTRAAPAASDDVSDDGAPTATAEQLGLVGRRYVDADDGHTWAVFATGYDPESEVIVAYIYDTSALSEPRSLLDCEYMDADELANGDDYDWLDEQPGIIDGADASATSPADDDDVPSDQALFAEVELLRISGTSFGISEPEEDNGDGVPIISFGDNIPTSCLKATAKAIAYADRQELDFFEKILIVLAGKSYTFRRARDFSDDLCPFFQHGQHKQHVRLRIEDISRDSDGVAWLHGNYLYSKSQLPPAVVGDLAPAFCAIYELAESIDQVQVPAAEVIGVMRVMSTSAWLAAGGSATNASHQGAAFIEEFDDASKWKVVPPKTREANNAAAESAGRQRRR